MRVFLGLLAAAKETAPVVEGQGHDWLDWVSLIVAAYGAVVASAVAAYQFLRDRPGVRLVFFPMISVVKKPGKEDDYYTVWLWHGRIVNHRKRPIEIRSGGLLIDGKTRFHTTFVDRDGKTTGPPFPASLQDGASVDFYSRPYDEINVTGAWASDALDHTYTIRYPSRNPFKRHPIKTARLKWDKWKRDRKEAE